LYEEDEENKSDQYYQRAPTRSNLIDRYDEHNESESEDGDDYENNPGIRTARSERGLKKLSVKVRDLVYKLKETSYKDVANRLIEELVTDDQYDDSGRKLDKKSSNDRKTKEEKNVRRRVYDALNVLIASGVLKKNINKNVMYEEKPETRMKGLKLVFRKKHENRKKNLMKAINARKSILQNKHDQAQEAIEKLNAIKYLIARNKVNEDRERRNSNLISQEMNVKINEDKRTSSNSKVFSEVVENIRLPFIILSTKNKKDSKIRICITPNKTNCTVTFQNKFSVMGDMDLLLKLGFHK
jgi:hypothetical protein